MAEDSSRNDSSNRNCMLCEENDSTDDMVQCDMCDVWAHYRCAGVTDTVQNESWNCSKCSITLSVPKSTKRGPTKKGTSKKTGTKSVGSDTSKGQFGALSLEESICRLEQEQMAQEREMEEQRIVHEKRLEMQRIIMEKKRLQEREMMEKELAQEKEMLEKRRADEHEFQKRRQQLRNQFEEMKLPLQYGSEEDAVHNAEAKIDHGNDSMNKVCQWMQSVVPQDPRGAYPKLPVGRTYSKPQAFDGEGENGDNIKKIHYPRCLDRQPSNVDRQKAENIPKHTSVQEFSMNHRNCPPGNHSQAKSNGSITSTHMLRDILDHQDSDNDDVDETVREHDLTAEEAAVIRNVLNRRRQYGSGIHRGAISRGPTREQLAARQAVSKHLPVFKGEPEVWPLFISCFEYTTAACGFTHTDNLKRLQDSLQGLAKEAVQSRLLLPDSVPEVIEDLRKLFGSPEKLLKSLIAKVRKTPSPRLDKLETFLYFGITVKQLADHLEAAGLHDHLNNPMLVQELVSKLPSEYKLDWVRFKRGKLGAPLRMFTDFISEIVSEVSEVADFEINDRIVIEHGRNKGKRKEFVNTHITRNSESWGQKNQAYKGKRPCVVCKRTDHKVRFCDDFAKLNLQERYKIVESNKLCKLCLYDHGKVKCTYNVRCNLRNCTGGHHPLLHRNEEEGQAIQSQCNTHVCDADRSVIFRTIPITLYYGQTAVDSVAFLDEGASTTLTERALADQLDAKGTPEPLVVMWTANIKRHENDSRRIDLSISARHSTAKYPLTSVRTVNELVLPQQRAQFGKITRRYDHLRDIPFVEHHMDVPRILIGLDNLHLFAPLESRIGAPGEPIAVRSLLGWTIYGPEEKRKSTKTYVNHHVIQTISNQDIHDMIRKQYTLDETYISGGHLPEPEDVTRARVILERTTRRIGERFETGLIWKNDNPTFPDSYSMALKRMKALERRLSRNQELRENIHEQIREYLRKGYCHKATNNELTNTNTNKVWYLPLNIVLNPKKPSKVRLVWDAAAVVNGVSLNKMLLKGPDLLTSLPAVISKFRERPVAVGGDIKEMYHQLRIIEADKQAQRFLFRFDSTDTPDVYVMDVATFGSTSSPCSAQFIKNRNANEYASQYPQAAMAIIERHYVDDYYDSFDTEEEAIQRASEIRHIHSMAGFEIRNWTSNSQRVLRALGENKTEHLVHFHLEKTTENERVLGISWNTIQDVFSFWAPRDDNGCLSAFTIKYPTKRTVLSTVMSLFDPIGLLAPITVLGKILIQDLWRSGCEWDQPIANENSEKWVQWMDMFKKIDGIKLPRSYFGKVYSNDFGPIQLHVFCDAGENAYGCVGFFRIVIEGIVRCSLVMARSKVAPLKQLSIPRLELQAAVLGARMALTIRENHSISIQQVFFWTDSLTVLSWIKSDQRQYKPFVGFRIGEILSLTTLSEWNWVPTKQNIADILTKWTRSPDLSPDSPWFQGPDFLYLSQESWPKQRLPSANTKEEMRTIHLFHDIVLPEPLINVNNISKWNILVRTVACMLRFISNCKRKARNEPIECLKPTKRQEKMIVCDVLAMRVPLKQPEYEEAENILFKIAQSEAFGDELKVFLRNQQRPSNEWVTIDKSSKLYKLTPLVDMAGVLRMEGRVEKAEFLPFDMRFPVILPKDHDITEKLVRDYHEKYGHAFRETVKNEIRQRFLILKINSVLSKVEKSCIWCKTKKNSPRVPRMSALPIQRLTPYQRPFTFVGVDYLGPVDVTIGRRSEKRWIVVFTCLVVRAIHLEVAHNLSASSCIMAIRRFICRRGPASVYFSDNGTNLRGASKELLQQIQQIDLECAEQFTSARTRWHFNPPSAPHMGGIWERMVRSVKEVMTALDDGRRLTDEILITSVTEVEDIINSRPLTYAPSFASAESLSPNHFLRGNAPNEPYEFVPPTNPAESLRDAYKRSQQLANEMWKRWLKEYVPTINQRSKWFAECKPLKKGDLVYIVEGHRRKAWIRAVVEEPIISHDGRVRQAVVRTSRGVFRRPTAKLAVLEIDGCNTVSNDVPEPELRVGDVLNEKPLGSINGQNAN